VKYNITQPPARRNDNTISATVALRATPSLVTGLRTIGADQVARPDTKGGTDPSGRWADRIKINATTALSTQIDSGGVPRKLEELRISDTARADDLISRKTQVDASCQALRRAIDNAPFRLSDPDRDLILFDEVRQAGVFKLYGPSSLNCTSDVVARWTALGITPPPVADDLALPVSTSAKVARLTLLATHWELGDPGARRNVLRPNFATQISLTAPANLLPGFPAPTAADSNGVATWDINPELLALLRKDCLGNFKPNADKDPWATGFVRFEGSPTVYLLRATFVANRPWGAEGPAIKALSLTEATADDRRKYDQTGRCLA
jgi:hypothetical protein